MVKRRKKKAARMENPLNVIAERARLNCMRIMGIEYSLRLVSQAMAAINARLDLMTLRVSKFPLTKRKVCCTLKRKKK